MLKFIITKASHNKTPWKEGKRQKVNQELETNFIVQYWSNFFQKHYIGEGGRLIPDILDISDTLRINDWLVNVDIEKAFDSLDHGFLVIEKKSGFGNNFIDYTKISLTNQKSCVINNAVVLHQSKLEKGVYQIDLFSAYLFIIALEIIFAMIKSNPNIKGLTIFHHNYLHTA